MVVPVVVVVSMIYRTTTIQTTEQQQQSPSKTNSRRSTHRGHELGYYLEHERRSVPVPVSSITFFLLVVQQGSLILGIYTTK